MGESAFIYINININRPAMHPDQSIEGAHILIEKHNDRLVQRLAEHQGR
jgi:hypothetical protein